MAINKSVLKNTEKRFIVEKNNEISYTGKNKEKNMKNAVNTEFQPRGGGVKPSSNASFQGLIKKFFESLKKKCCELSLVNSESTSDKQANDNKADSPLTIHKRQLSWIIASLGQVAHFTSVVIRNVLATSGWVRSAHTAPYAKSAYNSLVKAIAFTLAETLVVMGIIGVVAALTIPNLNQSTGDREKVAKLKKIYSNLEDAFGRATAVYGPVDEWFSGLVCDGKDQDTCYNRAEERLTEFMKVSKKIDGEYVLADGSSIILTDGYFGSFSSNYPNTTFYFTIEVNIDGPNKGKNDFGYDKFEFSATDKGVLPDDTEYRLGDKPCATEYSYFCTAWVIINGNMDYLKCYDELSWSGKTSCK